jgi:signal transduction histidine kinase
MFTVAVHRRTSVAIAIGALNVGAGTLLTVVRPQHQQLWAVVAINLGIVAVITAWGMFVRARRQLIWTLRERAERAEAEQRLQAEQARRAERTRIAREMHDVLAHRISLLALHAGALELRPDLPAEQVQQTAGLLRDTAHRALEELRGVIGVLRDDGEDAPAQPQPRLRDIPRLVDETRQAGEKIAFELAVPEDAEPPEPLGRDAYRIVQEALTNVAKHARGTATAVRVAGAPGAGLTVEVRNRLPVGTPAAPIPGAGRGLVGLQERVALAGGELISGPRGDEFVVEARLAWT